MGDLAVSGFVWDKTSGTTGCNFGGVSVICSPLSLYGNEESESGEVNEK